MICLGCYKKTIEGGNDYERGVKSKVQDMVDHMRRGSSNKC